MWVGASSILRTNGFQKARQEWTYNGRGKILTHTVSPGTAEGAAVSFTYDLHGHQATRTDFGNNVWIRIEDSCCDKQTASPSPMPQAGTSCRVNSTITEAQAQRRSIHSRPGIALSTTRQPTFQGMEPSWSPRASIRLAIAPNRGPMQPAGRFAPWINWTTPQQ